MPRRARRAADTGQHVVVLRSVRSCRVDCHLASAESVLRVIEESLDRGVDRPSVGCRRLVVDRAHEVVVGDGCRTLGDRVRLVPLFKRKQASGGFGVLLLQGQDMIERTASAHAARWGLGTAERWDLDQTTAVIRWSFPDKTAEAPAQILGSYSPRSGSWLWAWANDSLLPGLRTASEAARVWGAANDQALLTRPRLEVTEEQADEIAAIAFRVTTATGFYRAPTGSGIVYVTFGRVTIMPVAGEPEMFDITVE